MSKSHESEFGHPFSFKHCNCGTGYCTNCYSSCPGCGN